MKPIVALLSLAFAASIIATGAAVEPAIDLKKLAGTWRPVEATLGDIKIDQEALDKITLVHEEDRFTLTAGEVVHRGTFSLDPAKTPKTLDLFYTEGPNTGSTVVAVYEIDGDRLTACYSLNSNARPTELKSEGDQSRLLVKFDRKKE